MTPLEQTVGYVFRDPAVLDKALTHSSYANEAGRQLESNERLEFLGDAVLSILVSDHLFRHYDHLPEGELTKLRSALVCEKSLCGLARGIGLGEYLKLSRGEQNTGGRERDSILADAFEALLAAVYIDGGMSEAERFVARFVLPELQAAHQPPFRDYKTALQEVIQQNPEEMLEYRLVGATGPDHDKRFVVEVLIDGNLVGRGEGRSKKDAEQAAAHEALGLMGL